MKSIIYLSALVLFFACQNSGLEKKSTVTSSNIAQSGDVLYWKIYSGMTKEQVDKVCSVPLTTLVKSEISIMTLTVENEDHYFTYIGDSLYRIDFFYNSKGLLNYIDLVGYYSVNPGEYDELKTIASNLYNFLGPKYGEAKLNNFVNWNSITEVYTPILAFDSFNKKAVVFVYHAGPKAYSLVIEITDRNFRDPPPKNNF